MGFKGRGGRSELQPPIPTAIVLILDLVGNMGDSTKEVQNMSPQKLSFVIPTLF